jgi:N-acetyl-gamma-glutamyl-phosphate reductase
MQKIKAGIIGGAGYTGGELIRLLLNHPNVELTYVHSKSNAGKPLFSVHGDLLGDTEIIFASDLDLPVDIVFLCLGHGDAKHFLDENIQYFDGARIIDLSNDFRLLKDAGTNYGKDGITKQFVYGLPELNRDEIINAKAVANPGCFATAIQLGLLPLAKAGFLNEIYTTGITGSTGAGQGLSATSHFSWRANNIQAYKTLSHQHLGEISQSLQQLQVQQNVDLSFVPWRGDFTRGIFISSQLNFDLSYSEAFHLFEDYYAEHPFTFVSKEPIFLKQVVNTNKAFIQLEKVGTKLVVHSIIDNLLKGASGQAIHNMNLMFGFEEKAGLRLKANFF